MACAGASRDDRAATIDQSDLVGATEDVDSLEDLIAQARTAAVDALAEGDLADATWALVETLFDDAEALHDEWRGEEGSPGASDRLTDASDRLAAACKCVDGTLPEDESAAACAEGASLSSSGCSVGPMNPSAAAGWALLTVALFAIRRRRSANITGR